MGDNFRNKLKELITSTVRVQVDSGLETVGCIINVSEDYITLISVNSSKHHRYMPRTITVIPINKITAVSYFGDEYMTPITEKINENPPIQLNSNYLPIIAIIILLICFNN